MFWTSQREGTFVTDYDILIYLFLRPLGRTQNKGMGAIKSWWQGESWMACGQSAHECPNPLQPWPFFSECICKTPWLTEQSDITLQQLSGLLSQTPKQGKRELTRTPGKNLWPLYKWPGSKGPKDSFWLFSHHIQSTFGSYHSHVHSTHQYQGVRRKESWRQHLAHCLNGFSWSPLELSVRLQAQLPCGRKRAGEERK